MDFEKLASIASRPVSKRPVALMGFDGFIDTVARLSHGNGTYFGSMASLGEFLARRNESNCALQVSRCIRKIGGNMPICANALSRLGVPVYCVGAVGCGSPEPVFSSMHPLCSLYPVAMPGECLALEFTDSKLFLADTSGPAAMTWEGVKQSVGLANLADMADSAELFGFFNWGEIPNVREIWQGFAKDILPGLEKKRRTAVFDLSDCSGRSTESILDILSVISSFKPFARVVLSANDNELLAIARALGAQGHDFTELGRTAYASGAMDVFVHHSLCYARIFDCHGADTVTGIRIDNPVLITGGGDHFNAGLCLGLMAGLSHRESAALGITVGRLYVSTGKSPSLDEAGNELQRWEKKNKREAWL